ncbi:sensor domain-containing diguanylate cyclase [Ancylobacter mangrovi]|uniref:sensor domain-containing diguanylate cyclase n=1 Tax=Ancylobacter mangrovi TaxID=2972472 RepID=UPI002163CF3E|nr:sensor domain-containing diguanylate cyclase [Ancylobacter mangrovi]MCS0501680.1 GGDEF domain-containing protein [Ancylobacter mangrovi]
MPSITPEDLLHICLNFPIAACLIGRDGRLLAANYRYAELVDVPHENMAGRRVADLLGPAVHAKIMQDFRAFDAGEPVRDHETRMRGRTFLVAVQPIRPSRGIPRRASALCAAFADITDQKTLEARLELANHQLSNVNAKLRETASTDALTGLLNRHALEELLPREIARSRRDGTPLSVLMIDVDYFKRYNDRYGHLAGDEVLGAVARAMARALHRPSDCVARFGGEEFVAILPATGPSEAITVAMRMQQAISSLEIEHANSPAGRLTASIGGASRSSVPAGLSTAEVRTDLIERADRALYAAKTQGFGGINLSAQPGAGPQSAAI